MNQFSSFDLEILPRYHLPYVDVLSTSHVRFPRLFISFDIYFFNVVVSQFQFEPRLSVVVLTAVIPAIAFVLVTHI